MIVSKKSLSLLALASLATAANATDVTSLNSVTGGWHGYGFGTANAMYPVGTASLVASPSDDADGSLRMTGDRSRVGIGVEEGYNGGDTTPNFGTLDALANGSLLVDLYRSSMSQTNDARYNIGVKLLFANNQALTWENANNGGDLTQDAWVTRNLGVGNWFIRSGNVNYDFADSNFTLRQWADGAKPTQNPNVTGFDLNSKILGISFVVGSGISSGTNSFIGGADHLQVNFAGGFSDNYNFKAVPEPASMLALGLGAAAMLRRRRRA